MSYKKEMEVYRNQTIYYDIDDDKFYCDISVEDKSKTTKRGSLKDVRKEIDAFVKLNLEFKPFKVLKISTYDESSFTAYTVKGIRTDGKFMVYQEHYPKNVSYFSLKDMSECKQFEQDAVKCQIEFEEKEKSLREEKKKALTKIIKNLKKLDLSKYKPITDAKVSE